LRAVLLAAEPLAAQVVLGGRISHPRFPGTDERLPLTGIWTVAGRPGPAREPLAFRTWETEPVGWFRLSGPAGRYTLLCTNPAHWMRPIVLTNLVLEDGQSWDQRIEPRSDHFSTGETDWDRRPGREYWQTFVARGSSVTQVGFRLAHDGVDGPGPGGQTLLVSVHGPAAGPVRDWPQVGPPRPVVDVDSGGPKNYLWSAGWDSGQVPLEPGQTYAVRLRGENPAGVFQPFWRSGADPATACYRVDAQGTIAAADRALWLVVSSDGDGLRIPYNKGVHRPFHELTHCLARWSQSYRAQGRSLAGVVLYAAVSGAQPPLSRQRAVLRVRQGGPDGPLVGVEKVAVGNGNYSGDASWGALLAVFAPGEVPLEPGQAYTLEFSSLENYETLHGFVNIKGEVSNGRPGFNPYRKHPRDDYLHGTAYRDGREAVDFDLDLQVIEYEHAAVDWHLALEGDNLLANGDFSLGRLDVDRPAEGRPDRWEFRTVRGAARGEFRLEAPARENRFVRLTADRGQPFDALLVQRVAGLSPSDAYHLAGQVRSSWIACQDHQCLVGVDPTGQIDDPAAATIRWTSLPDLHGVWTGYDSGPWRPRGAVASVWLRARSTGQGEASLEADFDDLAVRRVARGVPGGP
jgi:hypothetical protein